MMEAITVNVKTAAYFVIVISFLTLIVIPTNSGLIISQQTIMSKGVIINVSEKIEFGFTVQEFQDSEAELVKDCGSKWIRCDIETIDDTSGPIIRKMDGYQNYGQKLIGIIDYWTIPPGIRANFTLEDWEGVVNSVATKYKGIISAYEIWNEPDGLTDPTTRSGYQNGPDHYFEMLEQAYNLIKSVDSNALVIAGALTNPINETFSIRLSQLGAANYFDAYSIHTYDHLPQKNFSAIVQRYSEIFNKTIWVTEIGYPSAESSGEQGQANFMDTHFNELVKGEIKPQVILWYMCRDDQSWQDIESSQSMGVLSVTCAPKLSFQVFKTFAAGSGS